MTSTGVITRINTELCRLRLAPDIDASAVRDRPDLIVIEDQQSIAVYRDPACVAALLATLRRPKHWEDGDMYEAIYEALHAQRETDDDLIARICGGVR